MRIIRYFNKPEYWFRPRQIFRKFQYTITRNSLGDRVKVRLPWEATIQVNPRETIGQSLLTLGVYELAVSETLWRLTEPGDWCLDVGANIGYMTGLLATKSQSAGKVFSFEPHPLVFARLRANTSLLADGRCAPVEASQMAIGATDGKMNLVEPEGFGHNEGVARLTNELKANSRTHNVVIARLDSRFCGGEQFGVVKVDVEGFELSVFQGAAKLLSQKRIRDIAFEDFEAFPSDCAKLLQNHGYTIFRIAKKVLGPVIWDPAESRAGDFDLSYEPINYLATINPQRALKLLQPRGWFCLKAKKLPPKCAF